MEDKILDKVLITTYTMSSLRRRLKALKSRLSEQFFGGDTNKQMVTEEIEWLNTYGIQFLTDFQKETFYQSFTRLEESVAKLKLLTLFVVFEPSEEDMQKIGSWLRDNYQQKIVIDLKLDKELIGGCAMIYNGVYKDYSIRSQIAANHDKLISSFKNFIAARRWK